MAAPGAPHPWAVANIAQIEGLLERVPDGCRAGAGGFGRFRRPGDRCLPFALQGLALRAGGGGVQAVTLRERDTVDGLGGFPRHQAVRHVHGHALRVPFQRIAVAAAVGAAQVEQVVGVQAEVTVAQQVVGAAGLRQLVGKGAAGHVLLHVAVLDLHQDAGRARVAAVDAEPGVPESGDAQGDDLDLGLRGVVGHEEGFLAGAAAVLARARAVLEVAAVEVQQREVGLHPLDVVHGGGPTHLDAGGVDAVAPGTRADAAQAHQCRDVVAAGLVHAGVARQPRAQGLGGDFPGPLLAGADHLDQRAAGQETRHRAARGGVEGHRRRVGGVHDGALGRDHLHDAEQAVVLGQVVAQGLEQRLEARAHGGVVGQVDAHRRLAVGAGEVEGQKVALLRELHLHVP